MGLCCPQACWAVAKAEAKAGPCALWKLDSPSKDMVESGGDNHSGSSADLGCKALTGMSKAWPPKTPGRNLQPRIAVLGLTPPPDPIPHQLCTACHDMGVSPQDGAAQPSRCSAPMGWTGRQQLAPSSLLQLPLPAPESGPDNVARICYGPDNVARIFAVPRLVSAQSRYLSLSPRPSQHSEAQAPPRPTKQAVAIGLAS
jgi:hypothetical protein